VEQVIRRFAKAFPACIPLEGKAAVEWLMNEVGQTHTHVDPELQRLRDSIDNIDAALIHMLAERFKCTKDVGELKARHGLPPADPARETRQIERLRSLAREARLDPDFAEKFLAFIIQEVIRHHEAIKRS
jgi:chorismate mutase